ncbi:MAG: hypothetical protein ACOH1V_02395 [Stenotrophomonas sp.]
MKSAVAVSAILLLSGCASVLNDTTHPIRFDAQTVSGEIINGANCSAKNNKRQTNFRSGETVDIRRSSKPLEIRCTQAGYADAQGRATSGTNAAMWGNIIVGGVIGAVVDHNRGTAYTYPTWVQLVFGEMRTYNRHDESNGKPVTGVMVSQIQAPAAAPALPQTPVQSARPDAEPSVSSPAAPAAPAAPAPSHGSDWRSWGGQK